MKSSIGKYFSGDKFIFYLMAYTLAKQNGGSVQVGHDSGYTGGQNYYREFTIIKYQGMELLDEKKISKSFADFHRTIRVLGGDGLSPSFSEYINEAGENAYKTWVH